MSIDRVFSSYLIEFLTLVSNIYELPYYVLNMNDARGRVGSCSLTYLYLVLDRFIQALNVLTKLEPIIHIDLCAHLAIKPMTPGDQKPVL